MSIRVIITGSRSWEDGEVIKRDISAFVSEFGEVTIVHGDAPNGADAFARKWAVNRGAREERHPADWKGPYKRRAGFMRNIAMAKLGADLCLAYWDGHSTGTQHMIAEAVRHGIPVRIKPARRV